MAKDFIQGLADGLEDDPTRLLFDSPRSREYMKGEKAGNFRRASLRGSSEERVRGEVAGLRGRGIEFAYESEDFKKGFVEGSRRRIRIMFGAC
ncbi:hypothetical protein KY312_00990 [Candidatus Woesearchaeota archaeon]|nr:hypothetical protein [Candidatus Woesearchaeota archaeon]